MFIKTIGVDTWISVNRKLFKARGSGKPTAVFEGTKAESIYVVGDTVWLHDPFNKHAYRIDG